MLANPTDREYLTTEEVAERCKVNKQLVFVWTKKGLPYYTFGRGWKFQWSEVVAFLRHNRHIAPVEWRQTA